MPGRRPVPGGPAARRSAGSEPVPGSWPAEPGFAWPGCDEAPVPVSSGRSAAAPANGGGPAARGGWMTRMDTADSARKAIAPAETTMTGTVLTAGWERKTAPAHPAGSGPGRRTQRPGPAAARAVAARNPGGPRSAACAAPRGAARRSGRAAGKRWCRGHDARLAACNPGDELARIAVADFNHGSAHQRMSYEQHLTTCTPPHEAFGARYYSPADCDLHAKRRGLPGSMVIPVTERPA